MISVAPTHDRAKTETEKTAGYRSEISTRPDVIETDYPYLFQGLDLTK
jgi:glycerophosphoryl diester phosphodiesterase